MPLSKLIDSNEWMKLGTRGLTFFVASGDDGVGCNNNGTGFEFPYPSRYFLFIWEKNTYLC